MHRCILIAIWQLDTYLRTYINIKYVPSLVFAIVSSAVVTTGGVSEVTFGDCLACNISCLFLKESTCVNACMYTYID